MSAALTPDLCVIGAGSGGLSVAAGAVQMGASVVLVEGHRMGGDCLNTGCVPSKALLAAASRAQAMRETGAFGVSGVEPTIDYAAVMDHVHSVIAGIAPHDSVERFEGLGVTVLQGWARFLSPREADVGGRVVRPRRFVIATGSHPALPPIPGLDAVPCMTSDTLWQNRVLPRHLVVIGAGPIGLEMAQAHRRLGAEVTVIEAARALAADDRDVAEIVATALRREGVVLREETGVDRVETAEDGVRVRLADGDSVTGSHLLLATGRRTNLDRLDLSAAGVDVEDGHVAVTGGLRSVSNSRVYAIGDAAGAPQFTHRAGYHAGLVIRSALFRLPVRTRPEIIPRVTYTDPEAASVGLSEAAARAAHGDRVSTARFDYAENDRARAERCTEGFARAVIGRRGRVLGCTIVGRHAGELIQPWALALSSGLKIGDLAGHVAAYPTLSEISKRAAGAWFAPKLFDSPRVKRIVRFLARLG